jgi:hypothetical protein
MEKQYESDSDGEGVPESGMSIDGGGEKKGRKVNQAAKPLVHYF